MLQEQWVARTLEDRYIHHMAEEHGSVLTCSVQNERGKTRGRRGRLLTLHLCNFSKVPNLEAAFGFGASSNACANRFLLTKLPEKSLS